MLFTCNSPQMRTDSNMRNLYDPVVAVQKRAALRAIICQLVAGPGASNVTTSGTPYPEALANIIEV